MAKSKGATTVARQVELIIRRLGSVSTLPEVAAVFLSHLGGQGTSTATLSDVIESDAALTAKVLSLAQEKGVVFTEDIPTISEAVTKLPRPLIRDAVLSVKVFQAFDSDFDPDRSRLLPRKQLALHALAVACCAKAIADEVLDAKDRPMAFSAGLLHDIGKLAVDEVMPRSFIKIVEQAKSQKAPLHMVEKEHLGLDHTIIGKRLAEKWFLPEDIIRAIWLHHSDLEVIAENMPAARIALTVQVADAMARQAGIGHSGSFDTPESVAQACELLGLSAEQVETIRGKLADAVSERSALLGLGEPGGTAAYCDLISEAAARLATDHTDLSAAHKQTAAGSAQMEFVSDFLRGVGANETALDVISRFAVQWQKHFQTGPVCAYVVESADEPFVEAVTVDARGRTGAVLVNVPPETEAIPAGLQHTFAVADAAEHSGWIFEQMDFDIDLGRARIAPLLSCGRAVGVVIFEARMPFDPAERPELFASVAAVGGTLAALATARGRHSRLAERFAELLGRLKQTRGRLTEAQSLAGIAEMAAGAAHELNNPLSLISGRAQLLYDTETDESKKGMLKQIQSRTAEITQIVTDLMSFARPRTPEPQMVTILEVVNEAIGVICTQRGLAQIETTLEDIEGLGDVYVDREQVVTAIVNVLSNSLDSYKGGNGPVTISARCAQPQDAVCLKIIDSGCGMDGATLAKACQPFFSARPAGRKRGMGLSHSVRLLELNGGSLAIASEPEKGATVTITLPNT
ncbi:MAG: HDOD domain-containing protein [Phycisphaerae bacterium]|nr:HDOD domain-containing protein [Phycisphaerae bacterium]